MHEQAFFEDLRRKVNDLARDHGGARVVRARLWLGALAHPDEARLRALWGTGMRGSAAADATLEIERSNDVGDPRAQAIVLRTVTFEENGAPSVPRTHPAAREPSSSWGGSR